MRIAVAALALAAGASVSTTRAADTPSLTVGLRLQGWYPAERHGAANGGTPQAWSRSPRGSRPATSAITIQTQVGF